MSNASAVPELGSIMVQPVDPAVSMAAFDRLPRRLRDAINYAPLPSRADQALEMVEAWGHLGEQVVLGKLNDVWRRLGTEPWR